MTSLTEAQALLISAAIEGPIAFAVVRLAKWPSRGPLHVGVASAVATAVTHPQLWAAAYWAYPRFPYWPAILVLEALVIGAEGVLIAWMAQLTLPRAMIVSLIANSSSFLFGLWLAS
ncbi:MAG: hypothetical protein ABSC25_19710 [Roseiarcus sp.]|jgi:hypothetical protein